MAAADTNPTSVDIDYLDMHEEIGIGELILRASRTGPVNQIDDSTIRSRRGNIVRQFAPFADLTDYSRVNRYLFGNFSVRIRLSFSIYNMYTDKVELLMLTKNVSGILNQMRHGHPDVIRRWVGSVENFSLSNLETFINSDRDWVEDRSRGLVLSRYGFELKRVGDWLLACIIVRCRDQRKTINFRLFLELIVQIYYYDSLMQDIVLNDLLSAAETWLVLGSCDSCLRKVLRLAMKIRKE